MSGKCESDLGSGEAKGGVHPNGVDAFADRSQGRKRPRNEEQRPEANIVAFRHKLKHEIGPRMTLLGAVATNLQSTFRATLQQSEEEGETPFGASQETVADTRELQRVSIGVLAKQTESVAQSVDELLTLLIRMEHLARSE